MAADIRLGILSGGYWLDEWVFLRLTLLFSKLLVSNSIGISICWLVLRRGWGVLRSKTELARRGLL